MGFLQSIFFFLGRLCLCAVFFIALGYVLFDFKSAEQHFVNALCDVLTACMSHARLQEIFEMAINKSFTLMAAGICMTFLGALLLLCGLAVRLGAFLLLCVLIPATLLFHPFWMHQGPERGGMMALFVKNIGIAGALFLLLAYGRKKNKKEKKKSADT
ncbi:MAG TPA: DoxX family membrane protein [Rhabdochlamydiaceae bacterium]|jgi:uncharacterized membrane protein YphA (DoxX/SURF4 family)